MDIRDILLFIIAGLNLALGAVVLSRNSKHFVNISYGLVVLAITGWAIGLAFFRISDTIDGAVFWARFYYLCAALIAYVFILFGIVFPYQRKLLTFKRVILLSIPTVLVLFAVFTQYHIETVFIQPWGKDIILGWAYVPYTVYFVMYMGYAFYEMWMKERESQTMRKLQTRYVLLGTFFTTVGGTLFNLFLPLIGNYQYIWMGPIFTLIMIAFIAYAVSRYRLFDIRLVVLRSIVYVILSTLVAVLFTSLSLFFARIFEK